MKNLELAIAFIRQAKLANPSHTKASLLDAFIKQFSPQQFRSVYACDEYAMRFSDARTGGFSNTVLSLSVLRQHDSLPFIVVVNRADTVDFLLSNATFLNKISHSSLQLRTGNVKGSFNGTDIMREYEGIANRPENIAELFALHDAFSWEENLERLVEATNSIVARDNRFRPSAAENEVLLAAPHRAAKALLSAGFLAVEKHLQDIVTTRRHLIVEAARIDNVNLRGNAIEQIITGDVNRHDLGDFVREVDGGPLLVDIKTKLSNRTSAPKAYNIDKMLNFLSRPGSVAAFFMIIVDTESGNLAARLLPVFESSLLDATVVQHHWAGRSSRGVTQLSGPFAKGSAAAYRPTVDLSKASTFLAHLIAL
jgi:hypothetical protein